MARNMLAWGSEFLTKKLQAHGSVSVEYLRGANKFTVTAMRGRIVHASNTQTAGAKVEWGQRDYLIAASEFARVGLDGPQEGDQLIDVLNGQAIKFEVMRPLGEPGARQSDEEATAFRLHCKQVEAAT